MLTQLTGRAIMNDAIPRRQFLGQAMLGGAALTLSIHGRAEPKNAPEYSLTVISGKPRERGRRYGERYKSDIRSMIDREIYKRLVKTTHPTRDDLLRYAGACAKEIKRSEERRVGKECRSRRA